MRVALRIVVFLVSAVLLLVGAAGLGFRQVGPERAGELREEVMARARAAAIRSGLSPEQIEQRTARLEQLNDLITVRVVHVGVIGLSLLMLGLSLRQPRPRPRPRQRQASAGAPRRTDALAGLESSSPGAQAAASHSKKEIRRLMKQAEALESGEGAEAAGELLFTQGLLEEAVEMFLRGDLPHRAAQVRHDQNRFGEAADLLKEAGKPEAAGAIYAQIERFEAAARCYLDAGKCSIAGEMFERSENFEEAGKCYQAIGFHRHAGQAYLRAGRDLEAAQSLMAAFEEEGGGGNPEEHKAKELRALACKAGELLVKLGRCEEAESILVRAGAYARAAKVAFQVGSYDRASELFLRIGRGDLAAKALERARDSVGAARVLGAYLRDKGRDEEAVEHLEKAGDYMEAADLYRKLELFEKSGDCYTLAGEHEQAAEMFRAGDCITRAAESYERCERFEAAAACYEESGDRLRCAELLEKAGKFYEAGNAFAEENRVDEAIRVLQRVDPEAPVAPEACALLGRLFQGKGMHSLSLKKFQEATGSGPISRGNVEAYYEIGRALERRREFPTAVEMYEKILSFDYHYSDVSQRLENVKDASRQAEATRAAVSASGLAPSSHQRYEVIRELGRGGMGVVHLARDQVLEREVAYKVLPEGLRGNTNALRNFLREAKASAQLNHPNIVTVFDAGESEHGFYLAMEFVDGTTLKEIISRRGPVAPAGVMYILRQMADALSYAHSRRVVHRDIKSANTMWTRDKQVKIMDFGLAKLMEEVRNATTLISGTPFYMSPEQTLGRNVDHRTDIYSLGVTAFELVTGELPFHKGNVPYHHVHTAPPDPRSIKEDVPDLLAEVILRCLEKDPDARFQDVKEVSEQFLPKPGGSA